MKEDKSNTLQKGLLWTLVLIFSIAWGITAALADDSPSLSEGAAVLTGLKIQGPDKVFNGTAAGYTAVASLSDGSSQNVTSSASWSDSSRYATFSSPGNLTTRNVSRETTITITARYSYKGVSKRASLAVNITKNQPQAALTGLSVEGAGSMPENTSADYLARASYSDGSTQDVTAASSWSEDSPNASITSGGQLTVQAVNANETVTVTASFTSNGVTRTASFPVTIQDSTTPSPPPPVSGSHAGRFTQFEGTKTCLTCHESQAREMHGSVHYQWKGDTRDLVDPAAALEGKLGGINDFCIYPDINWIGKLTDFDGVQVDSGCSKCHVGMGKKPSPSVTTEQLQNIDCLICHSPTYKRKVDTVETVNGVPVYGYVPDAATAQDILQMASDLQLPGKDACLNCHTKSGGGDNFKRGDIEEAHRNASKNFDVHMASKDVGGKGLECLSCHGSVGHRIAGRGSDLKGRDSYDVVDCLKCHSATPHSNSDINTHTKRVNCTVCHIPTFAKAAPTDMERDWSLPGEPDAVKKLYDPAMTKASNVIPEYKFWNGQSKFYNFGDAAVPGPSGRIMMSSPMGDINTPGSKIYAFKHHLGTQPMDPVTSRLLPLKIGLFFQNNDINSAVTEGAKALGWPLPNGYTFAETERYLGLFHEVAPKEQALQCNSCHGGTRLNFAELGYTPKTTSNGKPLCSSCHGSKSASFDKVHSKHVDDKRLDCSACHNFTKAN
jgi:hypothetical protein